MCAFLGITFTYLVAVLVMRIMGKKEKEKKD
jgi:hypothetical protein